MTPLQIMKKLLFLICATIPTAAMSTAMFCAIDGYNNEYGCSWYNLAGCRQFMAMVPGGACVMREVKAPGTEASSNEPQAPQSNSRQPSLEENRRRSNQKLLPLAPADSYLSPETEGVILSVLFGALEFDPENAVRNWENKSRGTSGTVTVFAIRKSQFDDPCRSFSIRMKWKSSEEKLLKGSACRHDGKWSWIE